MSSARHSGHRERMRERYLIEESFSSFADHEVLEMYLGKAIPRKNTNGIAHALLEHFGSLRNVMEASVEDLKKVDGIGEKAAIDIKLSMELTSRYTRDVLSPTKKMETVSEVLKFLYPKFLGQKNECVYLLMLDNRLRLLDARLIATGTVNQSNVPVSKMISIAYDKKIPNVVVAHNHPQGIAKASIADCAVTEALYSAFSMMGINLIEHLIFAEDEFFPILKRFPQKKVKDLKMEEFRSYIDENFYDVDEATFKFSNWFLQE